LLKKLSIEFDAMCTKTHDQSGGEADLPRRKKKKKKRRRRRRRRRAKPPTVLKQVPIKMTQSTLHQ